MLRKFLRSHPHQTLLRRAIFTIGLLALITLLWLPASTTLAIGDDGDGTTISQVDISPLNEMEQIFSDIYERVAPSVVSISVSVSSDGVFNEGGGTGFVYDQDGHIVTNAHVVESADQIIVNFFDGTITRGEVLGIDLESDIAVIQVDLPAERLLPIVFADSDTLHVGQMTLAIGSPFSNDWTLTTGIVSALNRSILGLGNFYTGGAIQTDAAINPGNSGGPLLNLNGEIIGINSQIEAGLRQNAGVGFAVPSNLVQRVVPDLIATGEVQYSYIGIRNRPIDIDLIEQFGLPNNIRGAAVSSVMVGGPAYASELRSRGDTIDIITAIDGTPVNSFDELITYLAIRTRPGQTVTLSVLRGEEILDIPVTLSNRSGQ